MSHTKERNDRWLGLSKAQLVLECQDLCKQRDELLAALERMDGLLKDRNLIGLMPDELALISSVKGGA